MAQPPLGVGMRGTRRKPASKTSFKDNMKAMRNLPAFLKLIWQTSRPMTLGNIALRLVKAVIPLAQLYVGKLILDEVLKLIDQGAMQDAGLLWQWVGLELGLAIVSDLTSRGISLLDALLGDLVANQTSIKLIEHASQLDLPQFEHPQFYDKLERARQQTTRRVILMSQMLSQVQDFVSILALGAGLALFNPWLILILLVAVVPAFLSETHFNRQNYSLSTSWTPERRELDYLRYVGASDETAKEVRIFGLSGFLTERFARVSTGYYKANRKLAIRRSVWGSLFNLIGTAGYYGAYVVIVMQTLDKQISVGEMTFLAGSFMRLRMLMQNVLSQFSSIAESALYLRDLFDFFQIKPTISSPEQPLTVPVTFESGFVFENVGFQYPNSDIWAIRGLNFTLKAGEKLALVGENGAGKTTLVKLLARLYDPSEGRILLDGKDLREYDLDELRKKVGVIFQDFVRFQMKVRENIAVGNIEEVSNQPQVEAAAEKSLAAGVVAGLKEGYEQMLGRKFADGVELSGGQWQKVALARAYMRDAQLIILDEPTAALDARAEHEVFQRFTELTEGKTAVLISHRFSTVRMADRILVLNQGKMAEIGSHEELLEKRGIYSELFRLQAAGYH